jgi:hypothetical protein
MAKRDGNRLVVGSAAWTDTIPEWLLKEVRAERLVLGLASILKPELEGEVGDAEVCVYLYTASMRAPMGSEHVQIYLHLASKLMKRRGMEVPADIDVAEGDLRPGEKDELKSLRRELWRLRGGRIQHPLLEAMRSLKLDAEQRRDGYQATLF